MQQLFDHVVRSSSLLDFMALDEHGFCLKSSRSQILFSRAQISCKLARLYLQSVQWVQAVWLHWMTSNTWDTGFNVSLLQSLNLKNHKYFSNWACYNECVQLYAQQVWVFSPDPFKPNKWSCLINKKIHQLHCNIAYIILGWTIYGSNNFHMAAIFIWLQWKYRLVPNMLAMGN